MGGRGDGNSCVIAVLAAGGSSRMGRPKQLLEWRGTTLIRRAAQTALDAALGPVVIMLGSHAEECLASVADLALDEVIHRAWAEGMGSTVACAAAYVQTHRPGTEALILMSCDQPLVQAADLAALWEAHSTTKALMAAASYDGVLGIPALFAASLLPTLMELDGDRGAAALLRADPRFVTAVPCPSAGTDVDTPGEFRSLG